MAACPATVSRDVRTRFYWAWGRAYAEQARRLRFTAANTRDLGRRLKLENDAFTRAGQAAAHFELMRMAIGI